MTGLLGWCFVCQRDGVALEPYRKHDGSPAIACADQRACLDAFSTRPRKTRSGKAIR